jgi:hypothetical protein
MNWICTYIDLTALEYSLPKIRKGRDNSTKGPLLELK